MKVLALVGSPRKGGNTDVLVDQVIKGAVLEGATVEKVYLNDLNAQPCQACRACKDETSPRDCVQADDLVDIIARMPDFDGYILGTPVYFFGPSAQTKIFMDRWYALLKPPDYESPLKGKRLVLAVVYGDSDPFGAGANNVWGTVRDAANYMGMEVIGATHGTADEKGEIAKNTEAMGHALSLGRKMARA